MVGKYSNKKNFVCIPLATILMDTNLVGKSDSIFLKIHWQSVGNFSYGKVMFSKLLVIYKQISNSLANMVIYF